jgi:chorismate mutase
MSSTVRALRGATTVDEDTPEQVTERVQELMGALMERNRLSEADIISIIFTATEDIVSMFPATAARAMGLSDVALIGAREISVRGALPRCIRALLHVSADHADLHHVYLHEARGLRDDLGD